jgi:hypothetical protein
MTITFASFCYQRLSVCAMFLHTTLHVSFQIQFLLIFLHSFSVLFIKDCEYPRTMSVLMGIQSVFMFMLFYDFYQKAYTKKEK